jgi:pilus assembly protein Flp/PilA
MRSALWKLIFAVQSIWRREEGQDLVEYALVVGLIAIAAVAGLHGVASAVKNVITGVTGTLNTAA